MKNLPLLISFLMLLISISCTEEQIEISTQPNYDIKTSKEPAELIPIDSFIIGPNSMTCGWKLEPGTWEFHHYQSVPGKFLGIWTTSNYWNSVYNIYGFNQIFIADGTNNDINYTHQIGFKYDSMMVSLPYFNYSNVLNSISNNNITIGYFHIDEPGENGLTYPQVVDIANYVQTNSPTSKVMISSYSYAGSCWPHANNSFYFTNILNQASNSYIMCDEYHGNCCGSVDDYWTSFRNTYGISRNISNWMHIDINNGNGHISGPCQGDANSWYDLIGDANGSGTNRLWLYALGITLIEDGIKNFSESAWERGWLRKFERKASYYKWKCVLPEPCDCNPNDPSQ